MNLLVARISQVVLNNQLKTNKDNCYFLTKSVESSVKYLILLIPPYQKRNGSSKKAVPLAMFLFRDSV